MRTVSLFATLVLASCATGCWARTTGGYAVSLNRGLDAQGAAVNAELGGRGFSSSFKESEGPFLVASVRTKFSRDLSDGGLGFGVAYLPTARPVSVYGHAGVHLIQLGVFDNQFSFGMFGPYLEAGVVVSPAKGFGITLGPTIQYDFRFTTSSQGWFGVNVGFLLSSALYP
jgi:hypothetical protein